MMTNNEIIKKAFEQITPSEELVDSVLAVESETFKPEKIRPKRKISVKRVVTAVCAACAIVAGGITAAAVTGILSFETVFEKYIVVKDSELANSLAGTVSNFKYKVSDEDYKIDVKGVTGTAKNVIFIAEISRKDGEPVVNHFANPLPDENISLDCLWQEQEVNLLFWDSLGGSGSNYINDEGNIELCYEIDSDRILNGRTFTVSGENFYPDMAYWSFKKDNNIDYVSRNDYKGYVQRARINYAVDPLTPADVDDSGIIALDLEWEFSFKYEASEKSLKMKSNCETEKSFVYYQNVYSLVPTDKRENYEAIVQDTSDNYYKRNESSLVVQENTANNVRIEVGSLGGRIRFEYLPNEYEKANFDNPLAYSINPGINEVFLIMADGTERPAKFGGGSSGGDGTLFECDYDLSYNTEDIRKEIVEIEDIAAISINGTVYELK